MASSLFSTREDYTSANVFRQEFCRFQRKIIFLRTSLKSLRTFIFNDCVMRMDFMLSKKFFSELQNFYFFNLISYNYLYL